MYVSKPNLRETVYGTELNTSYISGISPYSSRERKSYNGGA
jgi:hypothetical protein